MAAWNDQKQQLLDKYIHDYMIRKNLIEAAETFAKESEFSKHEIGIDAGPDGFLKEWWDFFWDVHSSVNPPNVAADDIPIEAPSGMTETSSGITVELQGGGGADLAAKVELFGPLIFSPVPDSSESSTQAQGQPEVFKPEDVSEKIERDQISVEVQPPMPGKEGGLGVKGETSKAIPIPGEGKAKLPGNEDVASPGSSVNSNGRSCSSC